jgi:ribosome-binding protein aMBF1 (putative translation factor)
MSDLKRYVEARKRRDGSFADGFETGYEQFKIGVLLRQAREQAGLTQEQLATRMRTKKSAISRIENHAENIGLATLEKYAAALGKRVHLSVS